jgi:hypothetical protein
MFSDLYDYVSLLFSWGWPKAEGEVTAVHIEYANYGFRGGSRLLVIVDYKFEIESQGLFTGETSSSPWFSPADGSEIDGRLNVGQPVIVRYRRDDPTVNRLDHSVRQYVDGF